ncbi:hypothetical protein RAS_02560 [Rickettsia asiatica]|uniref:Uncharacterized protein n=1 Tax=Rickettsia asiatica TaxID=238800 RepID=A0A510GFU8_9RICK|nr:hypothetical protein [Rickettsia asiatica]BBJ31147.1 hypothetical protein RAS_02560 [Rickettsia asiatica]
MFEFIETGLAIKKLYQYVKSEVVDQDFWAFSANDYLKLPGRRSQQKMVCIKS